VSTSPKDSSRTGVTGTWPLALALALGACATTPEPPRESTAPAATETRTEAPDNGDTAEAGPTVTEDDLRPQRPVRYTVRRGDTLWDIAGRFLRDPWLWPEIWSVNPQIANPHLIYPGDVIRLIWVDGEPRLHVERPRGEPGVRELEPQIRRLPLEDAIPSIPAEAVRNFLNRPRVVTPEQMDAAPYILGTREDRLIMATGDEVFARGIDPSDFGRYSVFRLGEALVDPDTGETLGYEAIHTGEASVLQHGDPARLRLVDTEREVRNGDRLLPIEDFVPPSRYIPKVPDDQVEGRIIGLFDAITQVATNQIVVLNRGTADGMQIGTVLGIEQSGGTVTDPYADEPGEEVQLPRDRVGELMIFRTFDRVSYALIMSSTRPVRLHDYVANP